MKAGRPPQSEIRDNIIEILHFLKKGHGYEIYKIYSKIFPKCTQRVIYYHLNQGVKMNLFKVDKIVKEQGEFSWGGQAEKIYYSLDKANPRFSSRVKEYFDGRKS